MYDIWHYYDMFSLMCLYFILWNVRCSQRKGVKKEFENYKGWGEEGLGGEKNALVDDINLQFYIG